MKIGTVKEVKTEEHRVGLTPAGAKKLVKAGHSVFVQSNAGLGAGFSNEEYKKAGAKILPKPEDVARKVDIIIKVKEPIKKEFKWLKLMKNKTLFTYLHLAGCEKELTKQLLKNKVTGIAYETVEDKLGRLPLLKPMSDVAGVLAVQFGAQYLQVKYGGRGMSLGVIPETERAEVVIIGGGVVGSRSALTAAGLGSKVTVLQKKDKRIRINFLKKYFKQELSVLSKNITILESNPRTIAKAVKKADLLIGSVLVKGAKAPRIVTKKMVESMNKGAVIVDVSIDQGGCIWGSRPTSHSKPIYSLKDKIYCCITNMPGQVSRQSTQALTSATLPYLLKMANKGVENAFNSDKGLKKGLNTYKGKITYKAVAHDLGMMNYYKELK